MTGPRVSGLWRVRAQLPAGTLRTSVDYREFLVGADSGEEARRAVEARLVSNLASAYDRRGLARSLPPSPWRAAEYVVEPVLGSVLEVR